MTSSQKRGVGDTYIAPTGLNPGTGIRSVEPFTIGEVQAIRVDMAIGNVQIVSSVDAYWCLIGVLVVCIDVVLLACPVIS